MNRWKFYQITANEMWCRWFVFRRPAQAGDVGGGRLPMSPGEEADVDAGSVGAAHVALGTIFSPDSWLRDCRSSWRYRQPIKFDAHGCYLCRSRLPGVLDESMIEGCLSCLEHASLAVVEARPEPDVVGWQPAGVGSIDCS